MQYRADNTISSFIAVRKSIANAGSIRSAHASAY
jgi:hypothetical protein